MNAETTPGGIFVPTQPTPSGFIKLTDVNGLNVIISAPFIVSVHIRPDGEDQLTAIRTTTDDGEILVREAFDTVMRFLCEVHG